jgi:hypothetical protein
MASPQGYPTLQYPLEKSKTLPSPYPGIIPATNSENMNTDLIFLSFSQNLLLLFFQNKVERD